jgi:hypothetical protein
VTQEDAPAEAETPPALPAKLTPGLSEIVKLAQAHVDESVILAYIKNSGLVLSPTADEILYLSDLGLSQNVIGVLVQNAPPATPQAAEETAAEAAPAAAGPPQSAGVFYDNLAPYGVWEQQPDYGLCWQPTVETINPEWRPYVDAGQWLYSDSGWYWQSDYTWGWAVFHYGRWVNVPHRGWFWTPGNRWAPAWVAWRSTPSYIGWAPLPPGASLNTLAQLTYRGKPAGPNATFGLPASAYSFVNTANLTSRNLPRRVAPAPRIKSLVQSSSVIDSYAIVNNRIFNGGASRQAVEAAARQEVPQVALRAVSSPRDAGLAMDRTTLAVYCPPATSTGTPASWQIAANSPRVQAAAEKETAREPIVVAENYSGDAPAMPASSSGNDLPVQLPPLNYPATASPLVVRQHPRENMMVSAPNSARATRDWPRGFGTAVEPPATPAPRYEGFNPPARQAEPPRIAVENRPVAVEPAHTAPVPPAAPASSGNSKSGK